MDVDEDNEEDTKNNEEEGAAENSIKSDSPKDPTPEPLPPKSPTPIKTPSRSITPAAAESRDKSKSTTPALESSKAMDEAQQQTSEKKVTVQGSGVVKEMANGGGGRSAASSPQSFRGCDGGGLFKKRSPFIHDPPQPEERRPRFIHPRTPKEYIINLREDLADFQESHGLPRSRDYSFLSLGLALAQETARAIYSVLLMFAELFPVLAIVSLILRFALDKLIEILETPDLVPKLKKSLIFVVEMIVIVIPLWILIGSIVIPLISLIFSMFAKMLRIKKGKKTSVKKAIVEVKPKPLKEADFPYFVFLKILCFLEKWCLRL